jgi:hypothetical protein
MHSSCSRREFIKLTGTLAAIGPVHCFRTGRSRAAEPAGASVTAWGGPGGDVAASPDYKVTVSSGGRSWEPFTYYSYNRSVDKLLDRDGNYRKLDFLAIHSNEFKRPEVNRDTYAHSWTHFDFAGGPVEVLVRIRRPLDGLTLPLEDCGILPSNLGIRAEIVASDTIRFTMERPAKIAVVPNHGKALEKLKTADPKQAFEGYRNPLFLFARAPETGIPDKTAPASLVIKPGQACGVDDFARAKVICFEPGVHDYSQFNPADPEHYITLQSGQTMHLAGGAYVYGVVNFEKRGPISEMPLLCGRGTLSGIKQRWTDVPYRTTLERNVRMDGIQIADPHNHISHSCSPVRDLAVVGAWHGNTDGLTRDVPKGESYRGWHIEDCFVMAADSNLKVGGPARVRNYTAWQLNNAEPFWIRNPDGCTVDGVQVIAYHNPAGRQTINVSRGTAKNSVFRNILIEAPFIPLLFLMPVSSSEGNPAFENVLFENVVVNTPHIAAKSPFGATEEGLRVGKVVFRNLVINGVKVTGQNCRNYFELLKGVAVGKEIVFE